jgi:hypothetical protein
MLGAIAGDIIGSVYEANPIKTTDFQLFSEFSRFTDDSVLTVATAQALIEGRDYAETYRQFGRRYPDAGYGGSFINWLMIDDAPPYNSWGNGSAMRVSPVGFAGESMGKPPKAPRLPIIIRKASKVPRPWQPLFLWDAEVKPKQKFANSLVQNLGMI